MNTEERELDTFEVVTISTFNTHSKITITCKVDKEGQIHIGEIFEKVFSTLGIQKSSQPYFAIFQGLEAPVKKYKSSDSITPSVKDLSLKKWTFDEKIENRILLQDPVALHLLYCQAAFDVRQGFLKPSIEQLSQLEEFQNPDFPLENQYVALCHTIDNYFSVRFKRCRLCDTIQTKSIVIEKNTDFNLLVTKTGIQLHLDNNRCSVGWSHIKSWCKPAKKDTINYRVQAANELVFSLAVETKQAEYLLAVTLEIVTELQRQLDASPYYADMIHTSEEETTWDNVMFEYDMPTENMDGIVDLVSS